MVSPLTGMGSVLADAISTIRRLAAICFGAFTCVFALALMLLAGCSQQQAGTSVPLDLVRQFCAPAPSETLVAEGAGADRHFDLLVPTKPPTAEASFTTPAHPVAQHDVISLTITSPIHGAVGIHGITAIEEVSQGQRIALAFRAVYSGRFAVHFHGVDGTHYELVALEVAPRSP